MNKLYIPPQHLLRYWWLTHRHFNGHREDLGARWSQLEGDWPEPNPHGIFFTACDANYFRLYAENYINSVARSGGRQSVHLHIYDGDDLQLIRAVRMGCAAGVQVSVTRDRTPDPSLYSEYLFAAGRFVVLPGLLAASRSPVVCTDVDVLVRGSFDQSVRSLAGNDVSLHLRPANSLPWRKVLASTVIALPTSGAQHYFDGVAAALQRILLRPIGHHVDQMILYFAFRQTRANSTAPVRFVPLAKGLIDWDFEERSLMWNAKGPERKPAYWQAAQRMMGAQSLSLEK